MVGRVLFRVAAFSAGFALWAWLPLDVFQRGVLVTIASVVLVIWLVRTAPPE